MKNESWQPPWKRGWDEIGGKRCFFRSSWEANYARYLQYLKESDEIADWRHEPETLWLGTTGYIPDFLVIERDGGKTYHEVKGFMDYRSRRKLSLFRQRYPAVSLRLITQKEYLAIERQFLGVICGWQKQRSKEPIGAARPNKRTLRCRVDRSIEQIFQSLGNIIDLYGDVDLRIAAHAAAIRSDLRLLEAQVLADRGSAAPSRHSSSARIEAPAP